MEREAEEPGSRIMRSTLAFLLSPPVAVLAYTVGFTSWYALGSKEPKWSDVGQIAMTFSLFGLPIAYGLTLIVGLPAYFALVRLGFRGLVTGVVSAFVIGSLFVLVLELYSMGVALGGSSMSYGAGSCDIVVDNVRTLCGYGYLAASVLSFGGAGAASGLAFWLIARPDRAGR